MTLRAKKVFPVLDSPAKAVTLLEGRPPKIEPLTRAKEKDGTEVVGNIITATNRKSRFTKENCKVKTRLFYDERGLDRYYGLLELGEAYGVFERVGNRYKVNGSSVYPKQILADPEKYFTPEVMQALDECAAKEFKYGNE